MTVVMVHGFLDTGRLFRTMARRLTERGHSCHAPSLQPRDARLGIPNLSAQLATFLDAQVPAETGVALVGFSLGGLVARHYLQACPRRHAVRAFFSIAAPYQGTPTAYLFPGLGTRQMRPGSGFLRQMDQGDDALDGAVVHTYWTPLDLMVLPARGAQLAGALDHRIWCPLHSLLPADGTVISHIAGELGRLDPAAVARPVAVV